MAVHNDQIDYPWAKQFLLTATRLIAKKRFEYLLSGKNEEDTFSKTKKGNELTPYETEIRNELAIDLRSLNTFSGVYIPEDKNNNVIAGPRYWEVDIEKMYLSNSNKADLWINRFLYDDHKNKIESNKFTPVILELKRIKIENDFNEVQKDFDKIIFENLVLLNHRNNEKHFFPYLFFWGWDVELKNSNNISTKVNDFIANLGSTGKIKGAITKDETGKNIKKKSRTFSYQIEKKYNIRYFPAVWDIKTIDPNAKWGFIVLIELTIKAKAPKQHSSKATKPNHKKAAKKTKGRTTK